MGTLNQKFFAAINLRLIALCAGLTLLCSCAMYDSTPAKHRPASTSFLKNPDHIYLTLHLENGRKLLFILDTGMGETILDKSLEPTLGPRVGTRKFEYSFFGVTKRLNEYAAPRLYLGNTPLVTGKRVLTDDLGFVREGHRIMGILGIDCLRHYCIRIDYPVASWINDTEGV